MAQQFWMTTGATIVVAAVMGLGLGNFATTTQREPMRDEAADQTPYEESYAPSTTALVAQQTGPVVVRCTGCGPTLAERQWHADTADLYPDQPDMDAMIDPLIAADTTYDAPDTGPAHRAQHQSEQRPMPVTDHVHPITSPVMVNRTIETDAALSLPAPDSVRGSHGTPLS
ncbi:hypothetical protein [Sphingobium sp.]|uniref:hypothetical protein n=1 Tax=Sphingobium sp. TaxID=1912891 RepID=UPI003BB7B5AD